MSDIVKLLKLREVATRLNSCVKTVRRRIADKELGAVKESSRSFKVSEDELNRYIRERSTRT